MQQAVFNTTVLFLIDCVQIFVVRHASLYLRSSLDILKGHLKGIVHSKIHPFNARRIVDGGSGGIFST